VAAIAATPRLQALVWIAPGHEVAALSREPAQCSASPLSAEASTGMALFNAPQILGGQAARARISCATCHANGRVNRHFRLEGVSGATGTADVSSSFFSLARANGRFDPKPIPDLAQPGKISRDPASGALERFLRGLIVEEFDGREPSPAVLHALADYVRSVRACLGEGETARTIEEPLRLVRASVSAAADLAGRGETEAAADLVGAARYQLGLIDERFAGPGLRQERASLVAESRALQPQADAHKPDPAQLRRWLAHFDAFIVPRLRARAAWTLYDRDRLAAAFAGRGQ